MAQLDSLEDLLRHYPSRYETIEDLPFDQWKKGERISIEGQIIYPVRTNRIKGKLSVSRFMFQSRNGLFNVTIFNRPWISNMKGIITIFGRYDGEHSITALQYKGQPLSTLIGIHPVYRITRDLTQLDLQKVIDKALPLRDLAFIEEFPIDLKTKYKLLSIKQALKWIHQPSGFEELKQAVRTLKYEEFLRFQTKLQFDRHENSEVQAGKMKLFDRRTIEHWMPHLPFTLTDAQSKVLNEILNDLQSTKRMYRLLQGDVGSGKTVIAALAIYATHLAHFQSAVLVPTEILAKQHYVTLKTYLPESIRIELLTASMPAKIKKDILEKLAHHEIDVLVGTHALISEDVKFANCGLVVADEQHRFGVNQRRLLSSKGEKVDFLLMSATPIPRTMANVLFGDLEISTIDQYHQSRQKIHTQLINDLDLKGLIPQLKSFLQKDQQIYVVCPAIDSDNELELNDVNSVYKTLRKLLSPEIVIDTLHGKLSTEAKETVLKRFTSGQTQVLVTTTVIEVGVNVLKANVMVIYDADRFGLSQLHQLRGRVGRGKDEGYCFLLTESEEETALARMQVLLETTDGFIIAEKDLELRGPGEIFGLKQSGIPSFLIANVVLDQNILLTALGDAKMMIAHQADSLYKAWIEDCLLEHSTQLLD
ncbi:MAG: ATP-dependent DNA helicase [Erysipelotrichaceae bacterium]|nr:MAG: ATP-dependent DNA helicase [Erysipelotrichaceae bacterium]